MEQNILVVDDSLAIFKILKKELEKMGFINIEHAENGEAGVEKFIDLKPDIVIMDITMPIMNGLEAAQKILDFDSTAKIILLSSMDDETLVEKAFKMGISNYLSKPINIYQMYKQVNELIGNI